MQLPNDPLPELGGDIDARIPGGHLCVEQHLREEDLISFLMSGKDRASATWLSSSFM